MLCSTWLCVRATGKEKLGGVSRERTLAIYVRNLAEMELNSEKGVTIDSAFSFERSIYMDAEIVEGADETAVGVLRECCSQEKWLRLSPDELVRDAQRLEERANCVPELGEKFWQRDKGKHDPQVRHLVDCDDEIAFRKADALGGPGS